MIRWLPQQPAMMRPRSLDDGVDDAATFESTFLVAVLQRWMDGRGDSSGTRMRWRRWQLLLQLQPMLLLLLLRLFLGQNPSLMLLPKWIRRCCCRLHPGDSGGCPRRPRKDNGSAAAAAATDAENPDRIDSGQNPQAESGTPISDHLSDFGDPCRILTLRIFSFPSEKIRPHDSVKALVLDRIRP